MRELDIAEVARRSGVPACRRDRSDRAAAQEDSGAAQARGLMFALSRNRFAGSYFVLICTSRS